MEQYKQDFIEFLVRAKALKFGEFMLKSGRKAPYFLNAGSFYTGEYLSQLGRAYAEALRNSGLEYDVIFGPAYKGIPLSVMTTLTLYKDFQQNVSYAFNRKEIKSYGMKDAIVGAELNETTRVVLIDDVITAGTAIRESVELLKEHGNPKLVGILIALDRMEKNNDGANALSALALNFSIPVRAIVNIDEVVSHLYGREIDGEMYIDDEKKRVIDAYRMEYGV